MSEIDLAEYLILLQSRMQLTASGSGPGKVRRNKAYGLREWPGESEEEYSLRPQGVARGK